MLTEEQKKQLEELQLFRNKEGNVSIEVSSSPPEPLPDLNLKTRRCYVNALL